jgi:hypothetical protein
MKNGFDIAWMPGSSWLRVVVVWALVSAPVFAQVTVTLQPETVRAFNKYVKSVEGQLAARWAGKQPYLSIDDSPDQRRSVLQGAVYVRAAVPDNPISIPQGLIHDWLGTIFIPNTSVRKVIAVLQDFDNHSKIYPDIIRSHLISRAGNEVRGEWRLMRKSPFLTLVLDVPEQEFYEEVGPGKWVCRAYAKNISEVENAGERDEKRIPPGQGTGLLWRLYGYWSLQQTADGVMAECRTLSLTRDVPAAVQWIAKPFLKSVPRDSLAATLKDTRAAALK